ncbi:hypothetical protein AAFC00_007332 [Neodothiora populina]|uniref:Uncharacterized protein n=1 Tax=Neodothiora populina TaxID=2781224 RepID=A0ABR3PJ23_9PEZI
MTVDDVSLVALIVSAMALIITTAQVLQQYFATADGYRQCQPSVMGPWARRTRMRWRWKEFRFETIYAVPRLSLTSQALEPSGSRAIPPFIDQPDLQAVQVTADKGLRDADGHGELVGWVYMLQYLALHDLHSRRRTVPHLYHDAIHAQDHHQHLRCPRVDVMSRSWDFVPSDVVRPLALTNVSTIAIIARRLGMTWKQFEPSKGIFLAEGNHQVILSTDIRGLGTCLHYVRDPILDEDIVAQAIIRRTSAMHMADDLGFGRIGRGRLFGLTTSNFLIGNLPDAATTLPSLMDSPQSSEVVLSALRTASNADATNRMTPVNDMIPFLTPFLGISTVERPIIPWPNSSPRGLTCVSFDIFKDHLSAYVNRTAANDATALARLILTQCEHLARDLNRPSPPIEARLPSLEDDMNFYSPSETQKLFDAFQAIDGILATNAVVRAGRYRDLVGGHLVLMCKIASENLPTDTMRVQRLFTGLSEFGDKIRADWQVRLQSSSDTHPSTNNIPTGEIIQCGWLAMFLRAMCWQRLHVVAQPDVAALPAEFEESKFPVYIC